MFPRGIHTAIRRHDPLPALLIDDCTHFVLMGTSYFNLGLNHAPQYSKPVIAASSNDPPISRPTARDAPVQTGPAAAKLLAGKTGRH
jgi:hypothetical protein